MNPLQISFLFEGLIFVSVQALASVCFFFVFHYLLNNCTRHFRHLSYCCRYISVTRDAHALRLTIGRMQFSIHFDNSKFSISLFAELLLFAEFELRF
jgi:ABC-type antimicrobial peptide transport system permease subunit